MSNKGKKRGILNTVVEEPVIEETNLVTEEQVVAQEEFINEVPVEEPQAEVEVPVEEPVAEVPTAVVENAVEEPAKADVKFEFQDEYHFGPGNGDAVIDTLPEEPCPKACADECVCQEGEKCDEDCICADPECVCEPKSEVQVEAPVKAKRTIESLTRAELHRYNTTGILPE